MYQYAYKLRREAITNGTWLTPEETAAIQEQKRKEQEKARRKKEREKAREQKRAREENQFRIKKEAYQLLMYRKEGYTYKQISEKMNYSESHLTVLKRSADKIFPYPEDLEEFAYILKNREAKASKQEQVRFKRELRQAKKEMKEQDEETKKAQKIQKAERKRKIDGYKITYKKYKKAAKAEDTLEYDGEENVSTDGRKKFIETIIALHDLGTSIPDRDIEIVLNTFDVHPEIADKASIKFLISDANKKGGLKSVGRMVSELAGTLRDTKFQKPLMEYGRWVKKLALLPQIQTMKKQGMNNAQIGERLGISSTEVSLIFHNDAKIELFDDGNR